MARKSPQMLKSYQGTKGWTAVGMDTSMTSIAVTAVSWDSTLKKMSNVAHGEIRWMPGDGYFKRLEQAAKCHNLLVDILLQTWGMDYDRVCIAVEEPFPMGMVTRKTFQASWIKQQSEIAGAAKGSLLRYGFKNIYEINNAQWKATLRREGIDIRKMPDGKFDVKDWAIAALGLPELPDLVRAKNGGLIPRPDSGFGAKAKPAQPSDIYDAAAVMAWMQDEILSGRVW